LRTFDGVATPWVEPHHFFEKLLGLDDFVLHSQHANEAEAHVCLDHWDVRHQSKNLTKRLLCTDEVSLSLEHVAETHVRQGTSLDVSRLRSDGLSICVLRPSPQRRRSSFVGAIVKGTLAANLKSASLLLEKIARR